MNAKTKCFHECDRQEFDRGSTAPQFPPTGNPAILVYSTKMAPTERPDIGYAMIFPSMTLVKVIAAQIVGLLATGGAGGAGG